MTALVTCDSCRLPVDLCAWGGAHPADPALLAVEQVNDAVRELDRDADDYLRWPWRDLDALYGGMAPGTVHYVVGFSGLGKSTFIASAVLRWKDAGVRVDVMPLEIRPKTFRVYLACLELEIDPGRVLSGDAKRDDNWRAVRDALKGHLETQYLSPFREAIAVHAVPDVTVTALEAAAMQAAARGASVLVIDHIDHIEGDAERARSLHEMSVAVNKAVLRIAQRTGLVIIAMSQANQSALMGGDHLAKYMPLKDNQVLQGGHKRQNATGMLGLYRPLVECPAHADESEVAAWKDALKRARAGLEPPHTALEPNTMGVNLMKSRNYGGREGQRVTLAWRNGRIVDRETMPYLLRARGSAA